MAAEAAVKYAKNLDYATAVPSGEGYYGIPGLKPSDIPVARPRPELHSRANTAARHKYGISLFAIAGYFFSGIMMVFVILAYISLGEVTNETVKYQKRYAELVEQERKLEIAYEQTFDLKEVESYAVNVLGMTKPDSDLISIAELAPEDKGVIIDGGNENVLGGLGSFLSSLLEYFK